MDGPKPSDLDQSKPGWYFGLMAPGTKPAPYTWVDPTRIFSFKEVGFYKKSQSRHRRPTWAALRENVLSRHTKRRTMTQDIRGNPMMDESD